MAGKAKWLRSVVLAILGASAFNGIMVFLFFDGTNFFTHAAGLWEKQRREECQSNFDARVRRERERMAELRDREEKRNDVKVAELARRYRHLDTLMGRADVLLRYPMPRSRITERIRTDGPFKIEGRTLSLCFPSGCVYSENLPDYLDMQGSGWESRRLGGRSPSHDLLTGRRKRNSDSLVFALDSESGPFQLWELYSTLDDSTVEYIANFLVHTAGGRLLRRDVNLNREGVFLGKASASGEYAVLDYGCCPGTRTLGILHRSGREILKRDYVGELEWNGDTLVFFAPPGKTAGGKRVTDGKACPYPGETLHASERTLFAGGRIIPTGVTRLYCSD